MPPRQRYRCRFCGVLLPAWLPVAQRPEASMRLYHLQRHLDQAGPYLQRLAAGEDIAPRGRRGV
jgi:hypothetical protein